jgi:hypothetical protein
MRKIEPCAQCGRPSDRVLFGDHAWGIHICSKKCEYEYLKRLTPSMREQAYVVRLLDRKIETNQRIDRLLWWVAGGSAVVVALSFVLNSAVLFVAGAVTVSVATLLTRYFEDKAQKLLKTRKRIII